MHNCIRQDKITVCNLLADLYINDKPKFNQFIREVAYVENVSTQEAANFLLEILGMNTGGSNIQNENGDTVPGDFNLHEYRDEFVNEVTDEILREFAEEELGLALDTEEDNRLTQWTPLKSRQLQSLISYNPSVIGRSSALQSPQLQSLISYNPSVIGQSSLVPYNPSVIGQSSAQLNRNIGRVSASVVPATVAIERGGRAPWGANSRSLLPRQGSSARTSLTMDLPPQKLDERFEDLFGV